MENEKFANLTWQDSKNAFIYDTTFLFL